MIYEIDVISVQGGASDTRLLHSLETVHWFNNLHHHHVPFFKSVRKLYMIQWCLNLLKIIYWKLNMP